MRVIVTADGVLTSLVAYFLVPEYAAKSPSWQAKTCQAVGLLYDYMIASPPTPDALGTGEYLSDFVRALASGTEIDGGDPTGLRWPAANRDKVIETVRSLNAFTDWCAKRFGGAAANPLRAATHGERLAALRRLEIQNAHSLLAHLGNTRAFLDSPGDESEDAPPGSEPAVALPRDAPAWGRVVAPGRAHKVVPQRPPFFPREHEAALFERGFARVRVRSGDLWERHNVRDLMLALLWRYGGLRRSEPLHLFVGDVLLDPTSGRAEVLLFHPQDGLSPAYQHPRTGATTETTRTEYLAAVWGLVPRNREVGERRAGWKNLMLERGRPHYYACVHWLHDDAALLFGALYRTYLRHVRPRGVAHPYLFCSETGAPLTYERAGDAFEAAMRRLRLKPSKSDGTTPHGLRHAYGQDLKDSDVDDAIIQICMHHNLITSQQVYTAPVLAEVDAVLSNARCTLSVAGLRLPPGLVARAARETAQ